MKKFQIIIIMNNDNLAFIGESGFIILNIQNLEIAIIIEIY